VSLTISLPTLSGMVGYFDAADVIDSFCGNCVTSAASFLHYNKEILNLISIEIPPSTLYGSVCHPISI
jgi:hypothetical protein